MDIKDLRSAINDDLSNNGERTKILIIDDFKEELLDQTPLRYETLFNLDEATWLKSEGGIHGLWVLSLLQNAKPKAKYYITTFANWTSAVRWADENDIDIITMSIASSSPQARGIIDDLYVEDRVCWFVANGNEGKNGANDENGFGFSDSVISVGAIDSTGERVVYSSYGEYLDIVSYTNIAVPMYGIGNMKQTTFSGTSCACPSSVVGAITYCSKYRKQYKRRPRPAEIKNFVYRNCEDLGAKGDDIYYGRGLFELPDDMDNLRQNSKELKMLIGSKTYTDNGNIKYMDTIPDMINDRLYVPARFVAETFGAKVYWNGTNECVTIKKKNRVVKLYIGEKSYELNGFKIAYYDIGGKNILIDAAPYIDKNDRTMIPVRVICDALGFWVSYNSKEETVTIIGDIE